MFKYLRETVDESTSHEDGEDLHEGRDDSNETVHQQSGHQHNFTAFGVG